MPRKSGVRAPSGARCDSSEDDVPREQSSKNPRGFENRSMRSHQASKVLCPVGAGVE